MPLVFIEPLTEMSTRDLDGKARPARKSILDVSQPYRPSLPVAWIALPLLLSGLVLALLSEMQLTVKVKVTLQLTISQSVYRG
jgi:hypothetical protein